MAGQPRIASLSSALLVKTPRPGGLSVSSLNLGLIWQVRKLDVGVKCGRRRVQSLWANDVVISGSLSAGRLSKATWTASPRGTAASICLKNCCTFLAVVMCPEFLMWPRFRGFGGLEWSFSDH